MSIHICSVGSKNGTSTEKNLQNKLDRLSFFVAIISSFLVEVSTSRGHEIRFAVIKRSLNHNVVKL